VLAYLEALCTALRRRDAARIAALLRHPLASALPGAVVDEARRIAVARPADPIAPIQTLRLYHQTAHLFGACDDPASRTRQSVLAGPGNERPRQMELDLSVGIAVA
jgi:hypothetical protein